MLDLTFFQFLVHHFVDFGTFGHRDLPLPQLLFARLAIWYMHLRSGDENRYAGEVRIQLCDSYLRLGQRGDVMDKLAFQRNTLSLGKEGLRPFILSKHDFVLTSARQ